MTLRTTSWSPPALAMGIALLTAAAAYWPGLSGGFLFDDFVNLDALGRYGGVRDWTSFWLYLTSGGGDPTGRPLSMLSFLLDGRDWPADPVPFKRTNLLLHLLNGALLYAVLRRLGRRAGYTDQHGTRAAALGATLWLLHPLWVSTTLYVVQRQAMLPLSFVLAALLLWDATWHRLEREQPVWAWLLGFVGVGLASLCAFLSKANGALTPALVALASWLLYWPQANALPTSAQLHARRLFGCALLAPTAVVVLALLAQIPGAIQSAAEVRPWSFGERLLSQPRALIDYLALLWLPREGSPGLEADQFAVSISLWRPWTTLPSLLAVFGLIGWALHQRHDQPALTTALLFFFVGHAMESSVIPLEPYFEHRNYLPAVLLFWPLAVCLTDVRAFVAVKRSLWLLLPLMLAASTLSRALLWGDPAQLVAASATRNPDSPRAQLNLALAEINGGRWEEGRARLLTLTKAHPKAEVIALNLIDADCVRGEVQPASLEAAAGALSQSTAWRAVDYSWFWRHIRQLSARPCAGLDSQALERLISTAEANPRLRSQPGWRQDLLSIRGQLALAQAQPDAALALFDQALLLEPNPGSALGQAAMLGSQGYPDHGLQHLQRYDHCCRGMGRPASGMQWLHQKLLWELGYYPRELEILEDALRQDISQRDPAKRAEESSDGELSSDGPNETNAP